MIKTKTNNVTTYIINPTNEQPTIDEIKVTRWKKGRPTVINWNGERWVYDPQTTFRGGAKSGGNAKKKNGNPKANRQTE